MNRTRKPPRKPLAEAHDSGRARRAEINASYHQRKMTERLAWMLERLFR